MKLYLPIVYIEYLDHAWINEDSKKDIKKSKAPIVKEVGFLLGDSSKSIKFCKTIIHNRMNHDKSVVLDEASLILKSDIIKLKVIKSI